MEFPEWRAAKVNVVTVAQREKLVCQDQSDCKETRVIKDSLDQVV